MEIYNKLYAHFGPQQWWPGENDFEVIVGAVLTQNTAWTNVEKAIANLKKDGKMELNRLLKMPDAKMARLIKPSGYFNLKTKRLKAVLNFLSSTDSGNWREFLKKAPLQKARQTLLSVYGIGPETADSILLYAANRPAFVIDAYTLRFGKRMGFLTDGAGYEEARSCFMENIPKSAKLYNEYHALLVMEGKHYCKPKPACAKCPTSKMCRSAV